MLTTPLGTLRADATEFLQRTGDLGILGRTAIVASYLVSVGTEHVVVMGGTGALHQDVEDALTALGVEVTRLAGTSRYDTAVLAAELVAGQYGGSADRPCFGSSTVGVARARVPFDSFSAAPLLARLYAPLVLQSTPTSRERRLPANQPKTRTWPGTPTSTGLVATARCSPCAEGNRARCASTPP